MHSIKSQMDRLDRQAEAVLLRASKAEAALQMDLSMVDCMPLNGVFKSYFL